MKYKFLIKRLSDGVITHVQVSEDADYQAKVPKGWGFVKEGWYKEKDLTQLGLLAENALEVRGEDKKKEYRFPDTYEVVREEVVVDAEVEIRREVQKTFSMHEVLMAIFDKEAGNPEPLKKLVDSYDKIKKRHQKK